MNTSSPNAGWSPARLKIIQAGTARINPLMMPFAINIIP